MSKILVIEDDLFIRTLLRDALTEEGYAVVEATDGEEGLQLHLSEQPDVVITDLVMPRQGGLTTIKGIRDRDATTPIFAISGGSREGKLSFLRTAGAFPGVETFQKPVPLKELLSAITRVLAV